MMPVLEGPARRSFDGYEEIRAAHPPHAQLRPGQVVSMKDSRVTVLDTQTKRHVSLSYAGIVLEPAAESAPARRTRGSRLRRRLAGARTSASASA